MIASEAPRRPRVRDGFIVVLVVVVLGLTAVLVVAEASGPPVPPLDSPVAPRYPDLAVAPLADILVGEDEDGRVFLRFSVTLVNVGTGPLLVAAHRGLPFGDDWRVVQRIEDATGGYSERVLRARLVFGGDAHDHWHVMGAEAHQLETLEGEIVGALVKSGFCFFDNVAHETSLPGAPQQATYTSGECGTRFDRDIAMGISVGWGDQYQWYLLDQTIEITGVPDGRYRLRAIADPAGQIEESDEDNNDTWTILDLGTTDDRRHVDVVGTGSG